MTAPRLAAFAAVILPVGLLGAAFAWFGRAEPAGALSERGAEIAAQLARFPPEIVVVGNSKASADIDGKALAEALDIPTPIPSLIVYGSGSPAWYALLEQRVFGVGHTPKLVVVYGQLGSMLHGADLADSERRAIAEVTNAPSEVLDQRVLRRDIRGRARDRAAVLHDGIVEGLRDAALQLAFPDTSAADGRAALDRLFSGAHLRSTDEARILPVAEARPEAMRAADEDPAAGFLPEIVRISHAHGARVVFVRAPVGGPARARDEVPAALESRLYALINAMGASWIDLHELALPAGAFRDDLHMTRAGAALLTDALADRIAAGNVLGGGTIPAVAPLRAESLSRSGDIPAVTLGVAAASGPCKWTVPIDLSPALSDDQLFAAGLGASSPVRLSAGGVELTPHAPRTGGSPCDGSFSHGRAGLIVSGPADELGTPSAWLDPAAELDAGRGRQVAWVYPGTALNWRMAPAPNAPAIVVAATLRPVAGEARAELRVGAATAPFVADGRVLRAQLELPPQMAPWTVEIRGGPEAWLAVHQLRVDTPDPHWIVGQDWSHTYLLAAAPRFESRVDGGIAPPALAKLTAAEVHDRSKNGCLPRLEAGVVARACRVGNAFVPGWLLEGDVATIHYSAARMAAHPLGIDTLSLVANAFGGDATDGDLDVEIVRTQGTVKTTVWRGSTTFPALGPPKRKVLRIDPPLSSVSPYDIVLRVGAASLLVVEATLSESEAAR